MSIGREKQDGVCACDASGAPVCLVAGGNNAKSLSPEVEDLMEQEATE